MSAGLVWIIILVVVFLVRNSGSSGQAQKKPAAKKANPKKLTDASMTSTRLGYSFEMKGSWTPWPDAAADYGADCGRLCEDDAAFVVIAVWTEGMTINEEALFAGLLGRVRATLQEANSGRRRVIPEQRALQVDFKREAAGGKIFDYRVQMHRTENAAFLFAGWVTAQAASRKDELLSFFSTIRVTEPPGKPDLSVRELNVLSYVLNDAALYLLYQNNNAAAVPLLEKSISLNKDMVVVHNLLIALRRSKQFQKAYDLLTLHDPNRAAGAEFASMQAKLEADLGRDDDAEKSFRLLFESGYENDSDLQEFVNLLTRQGKFDTAREILEARIKTHPTYAKSLMLSTVAGQQGNWTEAIEIIREILRNDPGNLEARVQLVETCLGASNFSECRALTEELIEAKFEHPYVYYLKARAESGLGLYREALASVEKALAANPADNNSRNLHAQISGMLGRGDQTLIKEPIAPVPADVDSFLPGRPEVTAHPGAYYELALKALHFKAGEESRRTDYLILRVEGSEGVQMYSSFQFPFDPLIERIFVNRLEVVHDDGRRVHGRVEDYYVMDDTQSGMASQKQILNVPVPGLAPGSTIHLEISTRDLGRSERPRFYYHLMSCRVPCRRSVLSIQGDVDAVSAFTADCEEKSGGSQKVFTKDLPLAAVREPHQAPPWDYLPGVRVGSTTPSWAEIASEYGEQIAARMEVEPVKELAGRLGLTRANALTESLRFIRKEIRYTAIEFGARGRDPSPCDDTLHRKYGDCKDQSVLLISLLRSAGVDAVPALIHSDVPLEPALPSMDQFNHMIVYVKEPALFVDPTARYMDSRLTVPPGLAKRYALLIDGASSRIAQLPDYPGDSSVVDIERRIETSADGLAVEEKAAFSGILGGFMRGYLNALDPTFRRQGIEDILATGGFPPSLIEFEDEGLDDSDAPLVLRVQYRLTRGLHRAGGTLRAALPAGVEKYVLGLRELPERTSPLMIAFPVVLRSSTRVLVPQGFAEAQLEDFTPHGGVLGPFRYEGKSVRENSDLVLSFACSTSAHLAAREQANQVVHHCNQALSFLDRPVLFHPRA